MVKGVEENCRLERGGGYWHSRCGGRCGGGSRAREKCENKREQRGRVKDEHEGNGTEKEGTHPW